jgi:EAL domain-containing protein (putative c-di-GMP-specific phosphodiesterase class I)
MGAAIGVGANAERDRRFHRVQIRQRQAAAAGRQHRCGLCPEHTEPGTPLRTILEHRVATGTSPFNVENFVADAMASAARPTLGVAEQQLHDGRIISVISAPLSTGGGVTIHMDVTEKRNSEKQIAFLAHHDALTGQLRGLGVRISMDDFGTGYSSLSYLRSFPFDKIKIDQSFVRDLVEKPDSIAIIRAVAGLGHSFGMTTTAEGVETQEQLDQMRAEGCTEVQGYFYSKPLAASGIARLLYGFEKERKRA